MRLLRSLVRGHFVACLVAVAAWFPGAQLAGAAPPASWRATALVTIATPIPDLPGSRFVEFGELFARPGNEIDFWARLAGREEGRAWALFALRDGRLRTILEEGEEVTSRYALEPGRKFHVHRRATMHPTLYLYEGELLAFTSHPGTLMNGAGVYGWDGEMIRPLLVPGQAVEVGGRAERIESAWGGAPDPGGGVQVTVRTAKPSKRTFQAVIKQGRLEPVDATAGVALQFPTWIEELKDPGRPFPFAPGRSVVAASPVAQQSAAGWVVLVITDDRQQRYVYGDGTRLYDLLPPGLSSERRWSFAADQIQFLDRDRPLVVYRGQIKYEKEKPYAGTQIFLFDGEGVRPLIETPIFDASGRTRVERPAGGPFRGLLIRAPRGAMPRGALPDEWPLWYLDRDLLSAGLQALPELAVEDGRRVSLGAVQVWRGEREALAVTSEAIERLESAESTAP